MNGNTNIVLKASVILIFDVIAIASFILWVKPTPDVSIIELIFVPAIIVINLISFFGKGVNSKALAIAFVINAFVAGFIFDRLFSLILEIFSGSSVQYKTGKYELHNDSIVLIDSAKRLFLINNQLIGYPAADGRIPVVLK